MGHRVIVMRLGGWDALLNPAQLHRVCGEVNRRGQEQPPLYRTAFLPPPSLFHLLPLWLPSPLVMTLSFFCLLSFLLPALAFVYVCIAFSNYHSLSKFFYGISFLIPWPLSLLQKLSFNCIISPSDLRVAAYFHIFSTSCTACSLSTHLYFGSFPLSHFV